MKHLRNYFRMFRHTKQAHKAHGVFSCDAHSNFRNRVSPSQSYSFISLGIPFVAPENRDLAGTVTRVSVSNTCHSTAVCPTIPGAAEKTFGRPLSKEHALLLTTCNPRRQPTCQIFCLHFPHHSQQ